MTAECGADCPGQIKGYRQCDRPSGHEGRHESPWHDHAILTWHDDGFPVHSDVRDAPGVTSHWSYLYGWQTLPK